MKIFRGIPNKLISQNAIILILVVTLTVSFSSVFYFAKNYKSTNDSGFRGGGYDFLAYYSAAKLAQMNDVSNLYNPEKLSFIQKEIIHRDIESQGYMPFLNPPFFALFLLPLSYMSIGGAQLAWLTFTFLIALCLAYEIYIRIKDKKYALLIILIYLSSFPLLQNYRQGQLGLLLLGIIILSIKLWDKGMQIRSGLIISLILIKPHIALLVLLSLILYKQWRVIKGFFLGAITLVIASLPLVGLQSYINYFEFLLGTTVSHLDGAGSVGSSVWEGSLSRSYGLNGLISKIFGQQNYNLVNILTIISILFVLMMLFYSHKKLLGNYSISRNAMFITLLVMSSMLINIHMYVYDIVYLLALPFLIYKREFSDMFIIFILLLLQLSMIDYAFYFPFFSVLIIGIVIYISKYIGRNDTNSLLSKMYNTKLLKM